MSKFKYSIEWQEVVEQDPTVVPEDVQTEQDLVDFIKEEHGLTAVQKEDDGEYSFIIDEGQEDEGFGKFSIYQDNPDDDEGFEGDRVWVDGDGNETI